MQWGYYCNIVYYSAACAIPDPVTDTVVVTGGDYTMKTVVRYGQQGWLGDLPGLIIGRRFHACSSYMSDKRVVSRNIISRRYDYLLSSSKALSVFVVKLSLKSHIYHYSVNILRLCHHSYIIFRCSLWLVVQMICMRIMTRLKYLTWWWEAGSLQKPDFPKQGLDWVQSTSITMCWYLVMTFLLPYFECKYKYP